MSEIIRMGKRTRYSSICNETLRDETLTWEARGVLAYLLSQPDNWTIRVQDLVNKSPSGSTVVRRILKELELAGYIHRERIHTEKGTFDWISEVYETPTIYRKPAYGSTTYGKPTYIINTESNNDEPKKIIPIPNDIISESESTTRLRLDINTNVKNEKASFSPLASVDSNADQFNNLPPWVHDLKLKGYPDRKKLNNLLKIRSELQVKSALEYYIAKHGDKMPHWSAALNAATKFFVKNGNTFDFNVQLARKRMQFA